MLKQCAASVALLLLGTATLYAGDLPDPNLTPGAVFDVDKKFLCQSGYTACVRHVTNPAAVYKAYCIEHISCLRGARAID